MLREMIFLFIGAFFGWCSRWAYQKIEDYFYIRKVRMGTIDPLTPEESAEIRRKSALKSLFDTSVRLLICGEKSCSGIVHDLHSLIRLERYDLISEAHEKISTIAARGMVSLATAKNTDS